MFKEEVTIWSSPKLSRLDDLDTIKNALSKGSKQVDILSYKLLKNLEDIKVYMVSYTYLDAKTKSKDNVK